MAEDRSGTASASVGGQRSIAANIRLWVGILAAVLLVVFFAQNAEDAHVTFLWMEWTMPLVFALVASAVLGAIATLLFGFLRRRGEEERVRRKAAELAAREK